MPIPITREEYAKKFGTPAPAPQKTPAANAPVPISRAAYEAKFNPKPFTYDVPENRQSKINRYQSEAVTAQKEAEDKKFSFGGFAKAAIKSTGLLVGINTLNKDDTRNLGNFGKEFVSNIAGSEVGLGNTIAKIVGQNSANKRNLETQNINETTKVNLIKAIREKEAKGEDTTRLKQFYNDTVRMGEKTKELSNEANTLPTTSQVAGQLGGTALDLLTAGTYGKGATGMKAGVLAPKATSVATKTAVATGLPELGKIAEQKATGIFTGKGAVNVLKGAGIGYGYDVTQGAQGARGEDRTGSKAFIPGAGTAIGGAIPLVSETAQSIKNKFDPNTKAGILVNKRQAELEKLDNYQSLKKATEKGRERGIDVKKVLAETDVLHGSVDRNGTITTKGPGGAVEQYTRQFIDGNEKIVSDALKKEGRSISVDLVKKKLDDAVMNAGIEGKALTQAKAAIDDEIAGYALRAGDNGVIPVSTLHDAKINKYDNINFFTEGNTKKYDKTIARALKELVEENTTSIPVKKVNEELSKHFAVIDYLNRLDNKKVEGGRLGKYFAQTIGTMVGSHFGPLGAVLGAEAGSRVKGGMMSRVFSGKTGKVLPQAEVISDALKFNKSKPLELPAQSSNSLGSRNMSQSTTIAPTINGIDNTVASKSNVSKKVLPNKEGGFIKASNVEIPKELQPLAEEARKYKSAEEFVSLPKVKTEQIDRLNEMLKSNPKLEVYASEGGRKFVNRDIKSIKADYVEVPTASKSSSNGMRTVKEVIFEFKDGTVNKFKNPVFSLSDNSKSQLTDFYKKANNVGQAGNILKSPLAVGAGVTAIGAGAAQLFKLANSNKITYKKEEKPTVLPVKKETPNTPKLIETIKYNETRGEENPYTFSQPSGNDALGLALGAYQITEGELKTYAKRYLGRAITAEQFLANPGIPDEYLKNTIDSLTKRGLSVEDILAVHNKGASDLRPEALKETREKAKEYIKSGMEVYATK